MISSQKERHNLREGLLIASNVFLLVFKDVTNHVPRHRREQSVFAFSRFTLHPDLPCLIRFYIHPVDILGPEEFLSIVC